MSATWRDEREDNDVALRTALVDLTRLLKCMTQHEAPPDVSWQSLEGRAQMAQELLETIQELWHYSVYHDESARAQDEARLISLQTQVEQACQRARQVAAERRSDEVDIFQEIFFPDKNRGEGSVNDMAEEEKKETFDDEKDESLHESNKRTAASDHQPALSKRPTPSPQEPKRSSPQNVQELQKAQRQQLETEISHMAQRLKESTQHMNTTLQQQTQELNEMQDLATHNVEQVSNVADNVTQHNRKSWSSTLATWTVLLAVLGSFVFCIMTIRMVPKQRNKCLFFCASNKQEEVCNEMEDGSIVCVNVQGKPYVKKAAHVSSQDLGKAAMECEVGDDGECLIESMGESNDEHGEAIKVDGGDHHDHSCNDRGECEANHKDEPDSETNRGDETGGSNEQASLSTAQEARLSQETTNNVVQVQVSHEGSTGGSDFGNDMKEVPGGSDAHFDEPAEGKKRVHRADMEEVEIEPVDEPAVEERHEEVQMENQPTTVHNDHTPDVEESFKPAEISTLYETFDDDDLENERDFTFLDAQYAVSGGEYYLLERILHQKSHFASARDENGWQLLHEACRFGQLDIVRLLLDEYKADVNSRVGLVPDGPSPLFLAQNTGNDESHELAQYLESRGGVSIADGENPPYRLASEHTPEELEEYSVADLNVAAANGDDILVAQYIVARPDLLSASDENGWSALHEAVRFERERTIQLLINGARVDINARTGGDHLGWSPLALSLRFHGDESPVTLMLLQNDAEILVPSDEE